MIITYLNKDITDKYYVLNITENNYKILEINITHQPGGARKGLWTHLGLYAVKRIQN